MEARTFPGLIGRKLGMAQIFMKDGSVIPVTTIEAGPCTVVQVKTAENDGYQAVQLGFGEKRRLKEPEKGHLKGLGKFRYLREFRWEAGQEVKPGQQFQVDLFQPGDRVDVTGGSQGKGFAGGGAQPIRISTCSWSGGRCRGPGAGCCSSRRGSHDTSTSPHPGGPGKR